MSCFTNTSKGSSWSHGSWIYNYLCNQCSSPLCSCEFKSRSWQGVLDTTLCDKVCQRFETDRFSPNSSTNKTDRHDITKLLLKMAFSTINLNPYTIPVKFWMTELFVVQRQNEQFFGYHGENKFHSTRWCLLCLIGFLEF